MDKRAAPVEKQNEKLTRLLLTGRDFQLALSAATFLLEDVDWEARYDKGELRRFYCYEAAFVISYARPFTTARGGVRPFTWKDTTLTLTPEERAFHERVLLDRNKLVAHSDADFVEVKRNIYRVRRLGEPDKGPFDFAMPLYTDGLRFTCADYRLAETFVRRALQNIIGRIQELKGIEGSGFSLVDVGDAYANRQAPEL